MAATIEYDDTNLQKLFEALTPKQRMVAMRRAFRREANRVRKTAVNNMRNSINADKDIERGIRATVFKQVAGFRVTIGTKKANRMGKGERGYYISRKRRGKEEATGKPVLIWAEEGTGSRQTRGRISFRSWKARKAHATGRMKRYGFMRKTLDETRNSVTDNLHNALITSITKAAKKYGCT